MGSMPYWFVIVVPFFCFCIFAYKDFKAPMFCLIAFSIFYLLVTLLAFVDNVDLKMLNSGFFFRLFGHSYSNVLSFQSFFLDHGIYWVTLYETCMAAILLVFLFLYFPFRKKLLAIKEPFYPAKSVIYVYHLSLYIFLGPALVIFIYKIFFSEIFIPLS